MLIHVPGSNERGTRDLLSVEAKSGILWAILTVRERSGDSFTSMLVSESLLVGIRIRRPGWLLRLGISEVEFCPGKVGAGLWFCCSSRHLPC